MADEKCICFEDMLKAVEVAAMKHIPAGSIDVEFKWDGYMYYLSGDYSPVNPKVNVSYRKTKVKGGHCANLTTDQLTMTASFCCYCGRKLKRSGD